MTALLRAVRALAGLDPAALDAVTPDAMRAVMLARGWRLAEARGVFETWEHDAAQGAGRRRDSSVSAVPCVRIAVAQGLDAGDARYAASEWAWAVATRHGDVAPAEVLAEALAWGAT